MTLFRSSLAFAFVASLLAGALAAAPLRAEALVASKNADAASERGVWSQWRGPERDGQVGGQVEGEAWPSSLAGLERLWRVDGLGPSYSGPLVSETMVFTTGTRDETYEVVTAHDRATGERLWQKQWPGAMEVPFFAAANGSWIRATPTYDAETDTLFVGGMLEVLVALDASTGAERWRIDFPKRFGRAPAPFGFVCSPLVLGDYLVLEVAGHLVKLDKRTGEIAWASKGFSGGDMTSDGTFSSPVFARLAGRDQLVVQTRLELRGVDVATGDVLWSQAVPAFRGMNILTPLVVSLDGDEENGGEAVFTSTYRNASFLYGVASACEVKAESSAECDRFAVETLWQNEAQAYMSSPVLVDATLYVHLGNGRLTALDLASGERLWTSKPFGKYWSILAHDETILALDEGGELLLIGHDREALRLLDRRTVADAPTWAHVALVGDTIFVREQEALAAWRWSPAPSAAPSGASEPAASAR